MIGIDDAIASGLAIINKFIPDTAAKEAAAAAYRLAMLEANNQADQQQTDIDKTEASSTSLFVAGARPAALWICVSAMGYQYLIVPVVLWIASSVGHPLPQPPALDDVLWQLVTGLLGLSGLRSLDKYNGVKK